MFIAAANIGMAERHWRNPGSKGCQPGAACGMPTILFALQQPGKSGAHFGALFGKLPKRTGWQPVLPGKRTRRRAFTLLEIIMAVAILGMMSLAIYRFVQSNITALRMSSQATLADSRYDALREILVNQWQALTPGSAALLGNSVKLNDRPRDEIKWTCGAGPGLLTRYAGGDYYVTMRLQAEKKGSDHYELGFLRKPKDDQAIVNENEDWVPLIEDVPSLEIHYFDPRLNVWLEKWTDTVTLPRLVKVTVGRSDAATPWEAIIPLGRTPL